ncbi:hypothetical protein M9Y10_043287 [Tritrichomonas musculus]|uniref:EGF-like domain-containing protein n=1 Tax=Tritrichomonas musculus TaxID=1915356 RepID=A0ABR2K0E3_9EUKA
MFIFFFNLATFILKKNHDYILSTKNHGQRLVKATALTSVSIQGTVQAGEEVTAILKPDDANNDDSGITYSWEIYSEEQPGASSSEEQPEDGWKVICTTKICKIPDDTPVGSKIRVKASGNGSKYTGDVTSEELLIETGSQDESSSEPIVEVSSSEEQGEASSSFEPPAEVTTSEEAIKPDACINNSNLHCNACDQSNPYICVSCKTGYIFNDKKVCIPLSDIKDCKDIPFCLSCADDISKCAECETGYHVSGGICELNDNNCSNVVTNCKHCENNPKFCNQCEDNYGLSNGVCTLCPTGLFVDNKSPCKPDCSIIPNCAICERYKGMIVCTYCNENYTVNEDGSSCVSVKDLPLDYCKNSYKDNGCVECNSENPTRCKTCNTGWTFLEDGFCTCHDGYVNNGRCYNETETACPAEITNCKYCLNEKCVECNSKYMLNNGQCTLIECNIEHCSECSTDDNNQVICAICERDYIRSVDKKRCVIEEFINCSSIPGCTKCSNVTNKCVECDTSNGYEKEPIKDYDDDVFCSCDQYHELYEGKCFLPILPLEPDPEPPRIEINSSMYEFNQEEGLVQITGSSENKTAIYEMQVSSEFKNIVVPDNITDITFNVRGDRTEDKPLIINSTESTEVTLKFIGDSAVKIPQDSSNIDIKGNGKIILMPFTEEGSSETPQQMTINKVVPTQGDEIEFDPRVDNLILNEIQTFGESKLIGSTDPEKKVTCKNLLIESGGSFTTDNIIFEKVKIGLKSALHLTSNNTKFAEGSNIYLFYNRTLTERHFPLTINRAYPDFSKSNVLVYQYEANKKLPVDLESEQLLVAQFVNDEQKKEDTYQQCLDLKSRFQRKNGFGDPDCVNSTKDNGEVDLIAHRVAEDKDSGSKLSGGAIAGIVIACVVVVAAIIALLVYFLVIKKRNQSTTSTQGDSSIAI